MIINERTIDFREEFMDEVLEVQLFSDSKIKAKGRKFVSEMLDFAMETIATMPFAFPEYIAKPTVDKIYRRAVFQRNYIIIYKVLSNRIEFIKFHHSSRNPDSVEL